MNWKLYIDGPEKRALEHCSGSMDEGDGDDTADGWGCGYGDGYGCGYGDGFGWGDGNGGVIWGDGTSSEEWK